MARTPQDVTEYELAILQALWESGSATIRQLTDVVYPDGGTAQYATVQKLLERLERKEFVRRDRSGSSHVFSAAIGREELLGRRLQDTAGQLRGAWLTPPLQPPVRTRRVAGVQPPG